MRFFLALIIILSLYSSPLYSQIGGIQVRTPSDEIMIGRVTMGNQMHLEIKTTTVEEKTSYQITYKDFRYPSIYELQRLVISNEETMQDLRKIILDMFDNKERTMQVSFDLEGETATLSKTRQLGYTGIMLFIHTKGHTNNFNKRQWENAFENLP